MFDFIKRLLRLNINKPESPPPSAPLGKAERSTNRGKPVNEEAFEQTITLINARLDNSNLLMIGLLVALFVCFLTLFYGYWQFASTSFNDYGQKVKELNNERYKLLENKIKDLELKISTSSAN